MLHSNHTRLLCSISSHHRILQSSAGLAKTKPLTQTRIADNVLVEDMNVTYKVPLPVESTYAVALGDCTNILLSAGLIISPPQMVYASRQDVISEYLACLSLTVTGTENVIFSLKLMDL